MNIEAINEAAAEIANIAVSKGWEDMEESDSEIVKTFIANAHGEVSELWESFRRKTLHQQCDKETSQSLSCEEEELADLVIRALHFARRRGINIGRAIQIKSDYNKSRPYRHGGKQA